MIKPLNNKIEIQRLKNLEERLAVELEERVELGCWSTNCDICNDYIIRISKQCHSLVLSAQSKKAIKDAVFVNCCKINEVKGGVKND